MIVMGLVLGVKAVAKDGAVGRTEVASPSRFQSPVVVLTGSGLIVLSGPTGRGQVHQHLQHPARIRSFAT
jgi:hypothetical protein